MMKMKRISALLLATAIAVSMSACRNASSGIEPGGSEPTATTAAPTPLDILKTANQSWGEDAGIDADVTATLSQSAQGVTMDIGLEGNVKVDVTEGKPQMAMDMSLAMLGETMNLSVYMDSEYTYTNAAGVKTKSPVGDTDSGENPFEELEKMELSDLEKLLLDSSVAEENGRRKLSFTISGSSLIEQAKELLGGKLEELGGSLSMNGLDASGMNMECSDIILTCEINADGYLDTVAADMALIMKGEGESALDPASKTEINAKTSLHFQMKLNNPGQKVTVTPPADLDEYTESSQILEDPELYLEAVEAVLSELYTDEGEPVKNYDEVYNRLCGEYGEETVQSIIDTYVTPYLNAT